MASPVYIPALQVRSHSLVLYHYPADPLTHKRAELTAKTYTGGMSAGGIRRIRCAVDVLLQRSPQKCVWNPITMRPCYFRLTFLTLTLSGVALVDHREAYRLGLGPFLDWLRRRGCRSYIWKAELQARGQIHYHVTTNQFIRYDEVRNEWNRLQGKAGWLDDFRVRFRHSNPNSTDIHAVQKVQRLDLYLAKYIAKSTGGKITGKVWGCSSDLAGAKRWACDLDVTEEKAIDRAVLQGAKVIPLERCRIIDTPNPADLLTVAHRAEYGLWCK